MGVTKRHYYRGVLIIKGLWFNAGCEKYYWMHIPFKFKITREKALEFAKFKDIDDAAQYVRSQKIV